MLKHSILQLIPENYDPDPGDHNVFLSGMFIEYFLSHTTFMYHDISIIVPNAHNMQV